jgi:hypothetical protein
MKFIEVLDAFEELGWDCPSTSWPAALRRIFGEHDLPLTAIQRTRCKRAFERGVKWARKKQPAITRLARKQNVKF